MWSGAASKQVLNESGEPIWLFDPQQSQQHGGTGLDPSQSFIGGVPSYFAQDENVTSGTVAALQHPMRCGICESPLHLVVQLHAPMDSLDRALHVFACNQSSCYETVFQQSDPQHVENPLMHRFSFGGKGIVRCTRTQQLQSTKPSKAPLSVAVEKRNVAAKDDTSGWGDDDNDDDDEGGWGADDGNDWGMNNDEDSNMDDLESMLADMEMKKKQSPQTSSKSTRKQKKSTNNDVCALQVEHKNAFPCYLLDMYDEPSTHTSSASMEDDDEDGDNDVGISSAKENDKVQSILAKYLAEEEDDDIVAAVRGSGGEDSGSSSGIGPVSGGERYEKLPLEERCFLAFVHRVQRAPRQVIRYAYGGVPFWSIPTPPPTKVKKGKSNGGSKSINWQNQGSGGNFPLASDIPRCSCGSERSFEFQVMPALLHILGVDNHVKDGDGMNFGAISIYSCSISCQSNREEFVVVQDSADGTKKLQPETKIAADSTPSSSNDDENDSSDDPSDN